MHQLLQHGAHRHCAHRHRCCRACRRQEAHRHRCGPGVAGAAAAAAEVALMAAKDPMSAHRVPPRWRLVAGLSRSAGADEAAAATGWGAAISSSARPECPCANQR